MQSQAASNTRIQVTSDNPLRNFCSERPPTCQGDIFDSERIAGITSNPLGHDPACHLDDLPLAVLNAPQITASKRWVVEEADRARSGWRRNAGDHLPFSVGRLQGFGRFDAHDLEAIFD